MLPFFWWLLWGSHSSWRHFALIMYGCRTLYLRGIPFPSDPTVATVPRLLLGCLVNWSITKDNSCHSASGLPGNLVRLCLGFTWTLGAWNGKHGDCMDLQQVLCVFVMAWCFRGTPKSGSRCDSDSFACSWGSFHPTGWPCSASRGGLLPGLTVILFCPICLSSPGDLLFSEGET